MTIGDRIKKIRTDAGLTQTTFAEKICVKQNTVASYEIGKTIPSDRILLSISREFGADIDWLKDETGPMYKNVSRADEISDFIGDILADESTEFQRRFIAALAKLSVEEWAVIEKIAMDAAGINEES